MRAGCLNIVQKTGRVEEPREYIPTGLTSNHTQWDSQWFYLRNNDDLFLAYTGRLISEHPKTGTTASSRPSRLDSAPSSMH